MVKVQEVIKFCETNGLLYQDYPDVIYCGGRVEKDVDVTSYRADQTRRVIQGVVYYPEYQGRIDPLTMEVTFEPSADLRNHPAWVK